ncbi:S8 family serine peptidase [Paenibacillus gansuensis]|uniref:S8 family serine peptidase n=1 Tax=Paenibacillus gansuensis TaxID=306542 RepID=A0ABW5PD71_9BACL
MKKGRFNQIIVKTIAASFLLTSMIPYQVFAEQRQLPAPSKIQVGQPVISPEINLRSYELTNVIVEFKQDPARVQVAKQAGKGKRVALSSASEKAENDHETFKKHLQKMKEGKKPSAFGSQEKKEATITREYRSAFNGVAMSLPGTEIERLVESGVVKRIWKDNIVKLDPMEAAITSAPKPQVQQQTAENAIPLEGIDSLHNQGIKGKGIKVGVLDTGIDYNHPDLKEVYRGGWDFIDNDADPMETTYQDWVNQGKPGGGTYYTSHGTHVSGTIAGQGANSVESPALGVAPEVDLYAYRVLGPYGSGPESGIIAGIDKAVEDGMDVINLSLGAMYNHPLAPESIAINNATLAGVTCLVAAGNAGPKEKTLSVPGTAALGITVGASNFSMVIPTISASVYSSVYKPFPELKLLAKNFTDNLNDLTGQTFPIEFAGLGMSTDFEGKDFTGKVALMQRGENGLDEKIANAYAAGAKAVLIYNNVDGEIPHYTGQGPKFVPSFKVTKADGEFLLSLEQPKITFGAVSSIVTSGNELADFSGRGPVNTNYDIKPDLVGPGVAVYSSYPEFVNSPEDGVDYSTAYARISGTSMATPHLAGVAALILQHNPDYTPFDVKAALMNTADDLKGEYSVYEVGAGEVDVTEAVFARTSIQVMDKTNHIVNDQIVEIEDRTGSIFFGNYSKREKNAATVDSRKLVIENNSKDNKQYNITVEYLPAKPGLPNGAEQGIAVSLPDSVRVAANQSLEVTADLKIPASAALGRYEGYIHIEQAGEKYQIPFAFRVVQPGIDYIQLSNQAIMTRLPEVNHPFLESPAKVLFFKLNSPMKTIDVLITDKDGRALGRTSPQSINALDAPLDEEINIFPVGGWMYPFIGDPANSRVSPIAEELPEGGYRIKMIATDADGRTYSKEQAFVVDNTVPELQFLDKAPGVYEVSDDMYTTEEIDGKSYRALWVHANLHDKALDYLAASNITQSFNHLYYYQNQNVFPDGEFPIGPTGDTKFGITPEDIKDQPVTLALFPVDMATNGRLVRDFRHYGFIQAGSDYVVPQYDKKKVYLGDNITMTLSLNNVQKLISGNYTVDYYKHFEFADVQVNPAFQAMAAKKELKVKLDKAIVSEHEWNTNIKQVKVGASITGNDFHGLDGDFAFLDVTFKLADDKYYNQKDTMNIEQNIEEFVYMKDGETEPTIAPVFNQINGFQIIPKRSIAASVTWGEAFLDENGWLDSNRDYTQIGSKVYAKAADGKTYKGMIDPGGTFYIYDLPVSTKAYDIIVEIPGHLKSKLTVHLSRLEDGELIGTDPWLPAEQPINYAGDVNGDQMIDIEDLKLLVKAYGKPSKKEDLNQDEIVDEKDVRLVEKNFLRVDPDLHGKFKPKATDGNKGLADYMRELGLQPRNS